MTMVENKRFEGIGSMESFFEKRASDFATLEVKGDEDGGKLVRCIFILLSFQTDCVLLSL